MATSKLGIVYPDEESAEVQRCLTELAHLFSERLDPLWLANREQELIGIVSTYRDEADTLSGKLQNLLGENRSLAEGETELHKRISQLEKRKSRLAERNAALKTENKGLKSRATRLEKRILKLGKRASQLEERNSRLKEERLLVISKLGDYRSAGRYKLADALAKNLLRIPGAKAVARRTRPKE